jgi:hypothetical protein
MRPTGMRALGTALVTALLGAVAGCGAQTQTGAPAAGSCAGKGRVVARADLDGTGPPQAVRLTGAGSGPCAHRLVGPGGASVDVGRLHLVPSEARVVHLKGKHAGDLVLLPERRHPRGGFQVHLFGSGGATRLAEIRTAGRPIVPFVATDGGAAPMTARCTRNGGIGIVTAKAHQPPGVILAWDVTQTTYALHGARAVAQGRYTIAEAAADPTLRQEHPELFDHSLFADCS